MDEALVEFLIESRENVDAIDEQLVALERDPESESLVQGIFRAIHTIKGTAGFFGFGQLGHVTHVGESLLSRIRDRELRMTSAIASALLELVDIVRAMLASIEAGGSDEHAGAEALCAKLTDLTHQSPVAVAEVQAPAAVVLPPAVVPPPATASPAVSVAASVPVEPVPQSVNEHAGTSGPVPAGASGDSSIRVHTNVIDRLMNLASELVLARNQIARFAAASADTEFVSTCQSLSLITSDLQEGVMRMRMQPIAELFNKLPRIVRDVASTCGKRVRLDCDGKNTDLDRTVLEGIRDPLTHIIRNALDHGIEAPEDRLRTGKNPEGTLRIRAYHEGGQVVIEIADDGRGIDTQRVRDKAIVKGLITAADAARMGERELTDLVFLPGFSTASEVTAVSGRGVGMDVVRTNIEKLGGTVTITSQVGAGTTIKIQIPLTLAIIPALVVLAGEERYAVPQVCVLELVRVAAGTPAQIEWIHDVPVCRLRGKLLPLVRLRNVLGLEPAAAEQPVALVVLQAGERAFGLVVDDVMDSQEIVVKPLTRQLGSMRLFSGATILGDGSVSLILDIRGFADEAGLVSESARAKATVAATRTTAAHETGLLLVSAGESSRAALDLSMVARLEQVDSRRIERSGGQEVLLYGGQLLPLLRLDQVLGVGYGAESETLNIVVASDGPMRSVGLVVGGVVDILRDDVPKLERASRMPGVRGTAVLRDSVIEIIDVPGLLDSVNAGGMA